MRDNKMSSVIHKIPKDRWTTLVRKKNRDTVTVDDDGDQEKSTRQKPKPINGEWVRDLTHKYHFRKREIKCEGQAYETGHLSSTKQKETENLNRGIHWTT